MFPSDEKSTPQETLTSTPEPQFRSTRQRIISLYDGLETPMAWTNNSIQSRLKLISQISIKQQEFDEVINNHANTKQGHLINACKTGDLASLEVLFATPQPVRRKVAVSMGMARNNYQPTSPTKPQAQSTWKTASVSEINSKIQPQNWSYFDIACRYDQVQVAEYLLEHKADPNQTNYKGFSPIYIASLFGSGDIIHKVFSKFDVDVCFSDEFGRTPLHLMALHEDTNAMESLLELGGDLLAEDHENRTPLYYTYLQNDVKMAQFLWDNLSYIDYVTTIDLSGCGMSTFPSDNVLSRMKNLKTLDVSNNLLQFIPPSLANLPNLQNLLITGNPLTATPSRIRTGTSAQILSYFRTVNNHAKKWTKRRVVVVGNKGVGKTGLIRALEDIENLQRRRIQRPKPSLPGSKIVERINQPKHENNNSFQIYENVRLTPKTDQFVGATFWEIGEDLAKYETNAFFLTGEAIFIVAFSLEKLSLTKMDYWVNKINLLRRYDSGCPIFLIGTHSDNSSCTKTYKDNIYKLLKERYPLQRFKGLYEEHIMFVSTTDYDGIAQLRDRMIELITVTKYSEKMFPQITSSNWLVVKDVLLQLQCTFGFQPDIIKLMKLSGIGNNFEDEINECVQFLMSTADILAFQINKRNLYILDIVWFAETIRELISVNNSLIKNGILSISDITNSLQQVDKKFAQIFKYLLESFQIVYKLPNSNSVMIPKLLQNKNNLGETWPTVIPKYYEECQRIYCYETKYFRLFEKYQFELLHLKYLVNYQIWKNGIYLQYRNEHILATYSHKRSPSEKKPYEIKIQIRYRENEYPIIIWVAIESLESIIRSFYPQLFYQLSIKIPCSHCIKRCTFIGEYFVFQWSELISALLSGGSYLYCFSIQSFSRSIKLNKLAPDIGCSNISVIHHSYFEKLNFLDRGGFGTIYLGEFNHKKYSSIPLAIKELSFANVEDCKEQSFCDFIREVTMMYLLRHPNIVYLFAICLSSPPPKMIMEYIPHGDLYHYIHKKPAPSSASDGLSVVDPPAPSAAHYSVEFIMKVAIDIASGMNCLHTHYPPIVHRDLRSPNIFLVSLDPKDEIVAKVADFGLSRFNINKLNEYLDTWQWMAPETFQMDNDLIKYDEKADIYSYGIILWELVTRQFPFDEYLTEKKFTFVNPKGETVFRVEAMKKAIKFDHLRPNIPEDAHPLISLIIKDCIRPLPSDRPSFNQILDLLYNGSGQLSVLDPIIPRQQSKLFNTFYQVDFNDFPAVDVARNEQTFYCCNNIIHIYDTKSSMDDFSLKANPNVCVLIDSQYLWVGCNDGSVIIYDAFPSPAEKMLQWRAHQDAIYAINHVITSELDEMWICSIDGNISIYPITAKSIADATKTWKAYHKKKKIGVTGLLQVENNMWSCSTQSPTIKIWDLKNKEKIGKIFIDKKSFVSAFYFSIELNVVCVCSPDTVYFFNPTAPFELLGRYPLSHVGVNFKCLLSVGNLFWLGGSDSRIYIYEYDQQKDPPSFTLVNKLTAHCGKILTLCADSDGFIWSGSFDEKIIIWDSTTYQPITELGDPHKGAIRFINVGVDSMWSVGCDDTLVKWLKL